MKLQRTSLVLLLSAALLAGAVAVYEANKPDAPEAQMADQTASQKVFDFEEAAIVFLTIETTTTDQPDLPEATPMPSPDGNPSGPSASAPAIALERTDDGKWALSAPLKVPANEANVVFLTNLLTTGQRDRTINVSPDRAAEFGFDQPQATIGITLADQTTHQLVLGKLSFDRTFLYAQIDPVADAAELSVSLVSPQFVNAVKRDLKEWQAAENPDGDATAPAPEATAPAPEATKEAETNADPNVEPTAAPIENP